MNQNQQNQGTTRNYAEVAAGGSDNPRWEPIKNENNPSYPKEIEGYFKKTSELPGKNGPFMVAEIQMMNADGTLGQCVDVSGGKVLEEKLRAIPLGSWIMIKYLGKVQGKSNTYNDWKTFVDEGAMPLHQAMGVAAPVQHFNQAQPSRQQEAPIQNNPFGNTHVQQNNAPVFNQAAPNQNAGPFQSQAQNNAAPVFNAAPVQNNAAPTFNSAAPAFNNSGSPVQNNFQAQNGQMPGVPQGTNPFSQQAGSDGLPF